MNQLGIFKNKANILSSGLKGETEFFKYNIHVISYLNNKIIFSIPVGYISKKIIKYEFRAGRWVDDLTSESHLSTGSLIISKNALPIPKISLKMNQFKNLKFFNYGILIKGGFSHGWISKENYIKAPFLHEKYIYFKKTLKNYTTFKVGLIHEALWGGETLNHGLQPKSLEDFLRVVTFRPGSNSALLQEKNNVLGNHLGVWDLSIIKSYKDKELKFYYQHPFEDKSGAFQYFFDELKASKLTSKSFDGLFGIEITNNNFEFLKVILYEYINTMNQSGAKAASDSTYGWDNYYNHYIYQSGWVNQGRVIGNPLFTLGSNFGHYSNLNYIVNNRIKAHHIGLSGHFSKKIGYKLLMTYSKNYGIYYDKNRFYNENKLYKFDGGIEQFSSLFELNIENIWKNINIKISYGWDRGELLDNMEGLFLKLDYNISNLSYSQ